MKRLPRPTTDLDPLLKGGRRLWNEAKPLKPVIEAEWLNIDSEEEKQRQIRTLRLVLQEGKKRQIRRMCRELLGLHVVDLVRTAIGPVKIESLPEGKWRTLTKEEVEGIFKVTPKMKKSTKKRKGNFE
jgi:pseudouridine synthase